MQFGIIQKASRNNKKNGNRISTLRSSRTNDAVLHDADEEDDASLDVKSSNNRNEGNGNNYDYDDTLSPQLPKSKESPLHSSGTKMRKDLRFSIPSNILFFTGSVLYLILAVIDYQYGDYYYNDYYEYEVDSVSSFASGIANDTSTTSTLDGTDGENMTASTASTDTTDIDSYTILSIAAASAFILNAMVDLARCVHYKHTHLKVHSLWHSEVRYDMMAAILFGIAACVDLWATIMSYYMNYDDASEKLVVNATLVSTHVYLLSAIFAILGLDSWKCCESLVLLLSITGDILFLIGSIIDVVISYMYIIPAAVQSVDPMLLLKLSLVSSILWLVDSILYLCSDCYCLILIRCRRRGRNANQKDAGEQTAIVSGVEMQSHKKHHWQPDPDWLVVPTEQVGSTPLGKTKNKMDLIFS